MTLAVCCMSRNPLLEVTDPGPGLTADGERRARRPATTTPEPVIVFARLTPHSRRRPDRARHVIASSRRVR
jgi:hypothetical protein